VKRAFSYERVSSTKQAVSGGGLDRQGSAAALWCAANGYELDQDLDLSDPGRSAFHGHHLSKGALGRFLELAQAGRLGHAPVLLVEAIDRISRQEPLDALQTILQGLLGSGVQVITLEDGAAYSRATLRDDPTKLILLVLKVQAAHEYSSRLSMRMRASWQQIRERASEGKNRSGARRPFWIDYDPAADTFQLNAQAVMVSRLFDLLEEGNGLSLAARQLNAEGFRTPGGKFWTPSGMQWVVRSPLVYGTATFLRQAPEPLLVPNYYPAVLSQSRYEQIQRLRRSRNNDRSMLGRRAMTYWIGQAISRCSCGAPVAAYSSVKTTKSKGRFRRMYLQCKRARHKAERGSGQICDQGMIHMEPVMFHVLTRLTVEQLQILFAASGQGSSSLNSELQLRVSIEQQLEAANVQTEQAQAKVKEGAKAGVELSLLTLLNDAVQEASQRAAELQDVLNACIARIDDLQRRPSAKAIREQLDPAISSLLASFAKGEDTPEQRRAVNNLLSKLQLRIHVDARQKRCGLQIGDGLIDWQPVIPSAASYAIREGQQAIGGQYLQIDDPDLIEMIGPGNSLSMKVSSDGEMVLLVIDPQGCVVQEIKREPAEAT
jgi:DNA invertase Pin-like site-specific DNA recombinase